MNNAKRYEAPSVSLIGDVTSLTAGHPTIGTHVDKSYPAGTPYDNLTWYTKK